MSVVYRFKISKISKILCRKGCKSHLLSTKSSERKCNLRKVVHVHFSTVMRELLSSILQLQKANI